MLACLKGELCTAAPLHCGEEEMFGRADIFNFACSHAQPEQQKKSSVAVMADIACPLKVSRLNLEALLMRRVTSLFYEHVGHSLKLCSVLLFGLAWGTPRSQRTIFPPLEMN